MKEVKMNGYSYWWDGQKLWLEAEKKTEVPLSHMTQNEKDQLKLWGEYNGIPMWNYNI